MNILHAILLSIVEGITEFLPVSSTGHLILTSKVLSVPPTNFLTSFEIYIQLGAICAVVFLYFKQLLTTTKLWKQLIVAFLPSAIIGLTFYKIIKENFLENALVSVIALFVGGVILIILEKMYKEQKHHIDSLEKIPLKTALIIGIAQSFSVIPGVSRAGATIMGGLFGGLKRKPAVEFSFLLAVPTMMAATGLDLMKSDFSFSSDQWILIGVGFIGSFIVAILAIKFLLRFIQTNTFIPFGVYRIILAVLYTFILIK